MNILNNLNLYLRSTKLVEHIYVYKLIFLFCSFLLDVKLCTNIKHHYYVL